MALPTVSQELRIAIAQARQAKNISQKDLAAKLMIPAKVSSQRRHSHRFNSDWSEFFVVQTIQEYEAGKAIPNNALIAKIERCLGCKLPRVAK